MSWKEIIDCLRQGEGQNIEFLNGVESAEHLLKHIISFLNNNGGRIIIGIDDKCDHLIGSNISANFIEAAIAKIDPPISIGVEETPRLDKTVILIKIPEGINKPYSYRSKFYYRNGMEAKKVTKEDIFTIVGQEKVTKINSRQEQTLAFIKVNGEITNRKFRELYKVSHKTAHIELTDLLGRGLIAKTGQGRNTTYIKLNK